MGDEQVQKQAPVESRPPERETEAACRQDAGQVHEGKDEGAGARLTPAEKQKAYRERKGDEYRKRNRERMREKRKRNEVRNEAPDVVGE